MEIINVNKPSLPEQVDINTKNIELLAEKIKDVYVANITINNNATTVSALNIKNWVEGTKEGFVLDNTGKLFKIVAVSDNTIYIEYWATLVEGPQGPIGPQGPQGPIGPQGPQGQDGAGVQDISRINLQVGEANVIYDTEDGITVLGQGNILTDTGAQINPETEMNVPLIAGNGLTMDATEDGQHVDIHLSAETQNTLARTLKTPVAIPTETEIVGIGTTGSQLLIPRTELTQSNPNILINGDFKVNQRGQTSYTTESQYSVDRWFLSYGSLTVNSDGSITHTALSTWQGIRQYIEFPSRLAGKTITITTNSYSTGEKNISLFVVKAGDTSSTSIGGKGFPGNQEICTITITIPTDITDNDKLYVILFTPTGNQSVTYYWAKMEIGNVSTAFSPRPYAEELAMCQRYYQRLFMQGNAGASASTNNLSLGIPIITTMRTTPTMTINTQPTLRGNGQTGITPSNIAINQIRDNQIVIELSSNGEYVANQIYSIVNGLIYVDAEIY